MSQNTADEIEILIRARYPLILIETYEEERVARALTAIAQKRNKKIYCWSTTRGLYEPHASIQSKKGIDSATKDPLAAMDSIIQMVDPALFVLQDFHPYLTDPGVVRRLRELAQYLKTSYKTVIFLSPRFPIPLDLEKDITIVDFPLPDLAELSSLLDHTIKEVNEKTEIKIDPSKVPRERILKAALGLTLNEAENVLAKSLVKGGRLTADDIPVILGEKEQIIRKSGMLEYYAAQEQFHEIGGLELLKQWLSTRRLAFTEEAREFGLPFPKGVLLLGIQGCGKSLCAKSISNLWGLPLLRFDVGRVFSSLVGSSEGNVRRAIHVAESVAPAILWVDEIEKAFSGVQSSATSDGGTTARVFGTFITWLQEKTSPVFVVATANNVTALPPELLRKGRLDEIFFVDLPNEREREEILKIHLQKRRRDVRGIDLPRLSTDAAGFSGAEIEGAVIAGLFASFENKVPISTNIISDAIRATVPLSRTMKEDLDTLRNWAAGRARKASLEEQETTAAPGERRFEL